MQPNIRLIAREILAQQLKDWGEPVFRVQQILDWLWKKHIFSFEEMTNLSSSLREKLAENYSLPKVTIFEEQRSQDGTVKFIFSLFDGKKVEGVLIPTKNRMTACVSSQVGCSLTCSFCATGKLGRARNLTADEIYDQVVWISKKAETYYQIPLSNIVYMGMGEPLLNYNSVLESIAKISSPEGLGMAAWRITVSTAGIGKMIQKLADQPLRFRLALSLHAADDVKRGEIMPITESNNLQTLTQALQYYYQKTKQAITIEYIPFLEFNDHLEDAKKLLKFCRRIPCKVNLIEYNSIGDKKFVASTEERMLQFADFLQKNGITTTIRRSKGKDIDAACGQLAVKNSQTVESDKNT